MISRQQRDKTINDRGRQKDWYVLYFNTRTSGYEKDIIFKTYKQALAEYAKAETDNPDVRIELMFAPTMSDKEYLDNEVFKWKYDVKVKCLGGYAYLEYYSEGVDGTSDCIFKFLDSDKQHCTNLYFDSDATIQENFDTCIQELTTMTHIGQLVDYGYTDTGISFARSYKGLLEVVNDRISEDNAEYETDEDLFTLQELKDSGFTNRIGRNYIFCWN